MPHSFKDGEALQELFETGKSRKERESEGLLEGGYPFALITRRTVRAKLGLVGRVGVEPTAR